jgi:uncharacterized paraquat-inducible protein A
MEKIRLIIAGLLLVFMVSCNSSEETDSDSAITDSSAVSVEKVVDIDSAAVETRIEDNQELGKEYTSAYICPNHCKGSGSDKEGECPKCGMELMENPNYKAQ